ncbi:MAG TPA: hypothetical protein VGM85_09130 [Paraburkholderia sp.]
MATFAGSVALSAVRLDLLIDTGSVMLVNSINYIVDRVNRFPFALRETLVRPCTTLCLPDVSKMSGSVISSDASPALGKTPAPVESVGDP